VALVIVEIDRARLGEPTAATAPWRRWCLIRSWGRRRRCRRRLLCRARVKLQRDPKAQADRQPHYTVDGRCPHDVCLPALLRRVGAYSPARYARRWIGSFARIAHCEIGDGF